MIHAARECIEKPIATLSKKYYWAVFKYLYALLIEFIQIENVLSHNVE